MVCQQAQASYAFASTLNGENNLIVAVVKCVKLKKMPESGSQALKFGFRQVPCAHLCRPLWPRRWAQRFARVCVSSAFKTTLERAYNVTWRTRENHAGFKLELPIVMHLLHFS
jgi:hypothetical protein